MRALHFLTLALGILCSVAGGQRGVALSSHERTRVRFVRDPQVVSFLPGNRGLAAMLKQPPKIIGNAIRPGELACDGQRIDLYERCYDFTPLGLDDATTQAYWQRLAEMVGGAAMTGFATELAVTDDFADAYSAAPPGVRHSFVAGLRAFDLMAPPPMITLSSSREAFVLEMRRIVRTTLPNTLIGRELFSLPQSKADCIGWDFFVVRVELAPEEHRGQTAIPFFRTILGERPIFLRVSKPSFHDELFWMATGAAGFHHDLPTTASADYESFWRGLRGFGAFHLSMPNSMILSPERVRPGLLAVLAQPGAATFLLQTRATPTVDLRGILSAPEFVGIWYNPKSDQNIVLPRTSSPPRMRLLPPSEQEWLFSCISLPRSGDADTTTPRVTVDPDFDLIPE